jgi:hypothetical protein
MQSQDCFLKEPRVCPPKNHVTQANSGRAGAMEKRLHKILKMQGARTSDTRIKEFAARLAECESRGRRRRRLLQLAHRLPKTDILFWISGNRRNMGVDEVLWRGFLAGHFGRGSSDNPDKAESATKILCAFGRRPYWTWVRVSLAAHSLKSWLGENREALKSLRFGNHRKYESHKPVILYRVIRSFIQWVNDNGGSPGSAFQPRANGGPGVHFDHLYHSLKGIFRFGRTGAFDLLCMLGDMGILPVRTDSCHLVGSTGPLRGARKLWGMRPPRELNRLADSTAKTLKIPFEIFEDALCMWQK